MPAPRSLTELGEGAQDTRRRVKLDELLPPASEQRPEAKSEDKSVVEDVLNQLTEARLITKFDDAAEVAHEALIREWPTLRKWLAENREGLRIQRRLSEAAQEWKAMKRHQDALHRGAWLEQALEWSQPYGGDMSDLEREFLANSLVWAWQTTVARGDLKDAQVYFEAAFI